MWGLLDRLSDCYKKPPPNSLDVDGETVGITGTAEIFEKALEQMDRSEDDMRRTLLAELKTRNYVPEPVEEAYLEALWTEFEGYLARRRDEIHETHEGIPREAIPWYPSVDTSKCEGCSSCVEFCSQDVFVFYDDKSHVARPYNCLVGKSSCRDFCPDNAISFPSRKTLKEQLEPFKQDRGNR